MGISGTRIEGWTQRIFNFQSRVLGPEGKDLALSYDMNIFTASYYLWPHREAYLFMRFLFDFGRVGHNWT